MRRCTGKILDHDVLVSNFFSMVARLVELSEPQFETGFECFFFAAIMVKLG